MEDEGSALLLTGRFYRHFHDPLALDWDQAGLSGLLGLGHFQSSLLWAQDTGTNPHWSWADVRNAYYDALTATGSARHARFKRVFEGIGRLIHLVQDNGQPAHVRNDYHPLDAKHYAEGLETWAFGNAGQVYSFAMDPAPPAIPLDAPVGSLSPITEFWDREVYRRNAPPTRPGIEDLSVGLAEYTNANYFSEDTTNSFQYPFPSTNPADYHVCEDTAPPGSLAQRQTYLSRTPCAEGQEPVAALDRLAAVSPLEDPDQPLLTFNPELRLDNRVREDYARHLIPRAVGYSAALIDYFFRNDIEITPPERIVYGLTGPTGSFQQVKLKARAVLTTGHALTGGEIKLVIVYRPALADPYEADLRDIVPRGDFVTIVVPEQNDVRVIPADAPVELTFDLSGTPLPLLATDVRIQIAYKGAIGDWPDAVAVGFKDLSEPTPIDMINAMDYSCLNGNYVPSGSPQAVAEAGSNSSWDIYPHQLKNVSAPSSSVYVKFSSIDAPRMASPSLHDASVATLNPATFGRIFILIDSGIYWSTYAPIVKMDDRDAESHVTPYTTLEPVGPFKNQDDVVDGDPATYFSVLRLVRGVPVWWGIPYRNRSYPIDDPGNPSCSEDVVRNASPNAAGPVAVQFP